VDTGGEVAEATRALADIDAIRRRVINVVGHALRTPVTTIAGMASALAATDDDDTRALLVEGLARNSRRVEALLDELLIAAGVTTALPVEPEADIELGAVVQSAWDAVASTGSIAVDGPAVSVIARPHVVERIVRELLDNACKYGQGTLTVRVETAEGVVRLRVESMADGPSDEELAHAFELLYRGEHAVTAAPGLGIGLPVARELARAEGGDVTLERAGDLLVATLVLPR
jgi:two-component system phosphate regulon sensor histidine kinase PhoR